MVNRLTPLCSTVNKTGCAELLSGNETCKEPIYISLPDTLNVSKCINESFMICENGSLTSDSQVQSVINATAEDELSGYFGPLVIGSHVKIPFVGDRQASVSYHPFKSIFPLDKDGAET
ncbi:uncharacterized protein LOC142591484 [Dermacentor variabilis]|uniref:uncharacterized protein LOC142591484 n=1 Tax=Dermacentor variabilis TaxID=34621 RepID=UPI003F5AF68F